MGIRYSLYDYAIHDDPYPVYGRLREHAPVYRNDAEDFWALSRHEDVATAYRDFRRFSNANGVLIDPSAWGPQARALQSFVAMDPPEHTRVRGLVFRAFTPRLIAALEPRIREIARGHLDRALENTSFDFVEDFAALLPMDVISELVGVPEADRAEVRRAAHLILQHEEGVHDMTAAGREAIGAQIAYFRDLVVERRRERRDDLVSALLTAAEDDDHLTEAEIVGVLALIAGAGNETTTHLLSGAWYCAWRHLDRPSDAYDRIGPWIEETLRLESPAQGTARTVTEEFTLHGVTVPANARMQLLIGSANRDPRVFADPDRFDLDRDDTSKISFGSGRHYCVGANLARLEARVALEELTARVADYDIDESGARRARTPTVRGFTALPTTVTLRPSRG
ncbi:LOW QUALITY PROTEIN: hypothetical protein BZB76_1978 [Actinomadura pelletieri DSM 43383]|uniref:Cytochrome P450 n=2 Tax=Actinomadura pelletieri TaxID=111805 RepID=A0A495QT91_9ACTN|nr:LOW QUALITY PROTEIN: hypothetical protein BZB76_1978 [Actinomadura pelletieri DSM 43383]